MRITVSGAYAREPSRPYEAALLEICANRNLSSLSKIKTLLLELIRSLDYMEEKQRLLYLISHVKEGTPSVFINESMGGMLFWRRKPKQQRI